ncbi:hypothetical protein NliqN6_5809 [Naganishia liquefaciens]|uniref:Uncharacterized protein n=1 Tax=Naganishia liquefaciens TaxID=104408 RepID=A0A8H3TYE7_9TREE|nr:hypothetical protein NliqN6_5809 [Naganishia liquefaciens]
MSLYKGEIHGFYAFQKRIQKPSFNCAQTVKWLLTKPGVVRQMYITHLIFLYSHFSTSRRAEPQDGRLDTRESSIRQALYNLRQVIHGIAHNDGPEPRAEKHFKVKLSIWQEHLLRHFEILAPFPEGTETEEEALTFMWGETWKEKLHLQPDCNFVKLGAPAEYAYEFGYSFPQIVRLCHSVQDSQDDAEPITTLTVNALCKDFEYVWNSILKRCNTDDPQRPRQVKIKTESMPFTPKNRFPEFLTDMKFPRLTASGRFPASQLGESTEEYERSFALLQPFDNSGAGAKSAQEADSKGRSLTEVLRKREIVLMNVIRPQVTSDASKPMSESPQQSIYGYNRTDSDNGRLGPGWDVKVEDVPRASQREDYQDFFVSESERDTVSLGPSRSPTPPYVAFENQCGCPSHPDQSERKSQADAIDVQVEHTSASVQTDLSRFGFHRLPRETSRNTAPPSTASELDVPRLASRIKEFRRVDGDANDSAGGVESGGARKRSADEAGLEMDTRELDNGLSTKQKTSDDTSCNWHSSGSARDHKLIAWTSGVSRGSAKPLR